jgi:molybdopterin/thiamine biosynthesis adenylyltransferase/rhodanese-related sulfurtransferase
MPLLPDELQRYSRQILLPEFGIGGQERLKNARVLIVGAGGLGSPAALYLAAMGVGTIGIIDDDTVVISNLHRQILYRDSDVGQSKATLAESRLSEINPSTTIRSFDKRLTPENVIKILKAFDFVLDGTDNFSTRYLVNDACLVLGIPLISASILKFEGQLTVLCANNGPCYRCLFPEPPNAADAPSCAEAGVMGALAGVMGTMMAMEAIKIIAGIGEPLSGRIMIYDALNANVRTFNVNRDSACLACSISYSERKLFDSYEFDDCKDNADEISWETFAKRPMPLIDVREEWEFLAAPSSGKLIPLGSLLDHIEALPNEEFAIVCASGIRSLKAIISLREHGIKAKSIRGGMSSRNNYDINHFNLM